MIWPSLLSAARHILTPPQTPPPQRIRRSSVPGLILGMGHSIFDDAEDAAVVIPWSTLNRHAYILGSTGSGKTVLQRQVAYQLVKAGYGVLLIDLKGETELMNDLWRGCVATGREKDFVYLSPILSEKFCEQTATWNPLLSGDASLVTARLADAFAVPSPEAEFWEKVKADIIMSLMTAIKDTGRTATFADLSYALSSPSTLERLAAMTPPTGKGKAMLHNLIREWRDNVRIYTAYVKGTKVAFQSLSSGLPATICCTTQPTLDLARAVETRQVIYCYLPTMYARDAMRWIGRLLLAELKNIFADIQAFQDKPAKFAIVVDEFQELAFPSVLDLFNKARSAGVSLVVSHQTLSDLEFQMKTASFGAALLDNTASKVIMQVKSKDTAESLSKIIGEYPPMPIVSRFMPARYLVQPDILMGKNELYEDGLDIGELVAKIDGEIYRVKVPSGRKREQQRPGIDIPRPSTDYSPIPVPEPLHLHTLPVGRDDLLVPERGRRGRRRRPDEEIPWAGGDAEESLGPPPELS